MTNRGRSIKWVIKRENDRKCSGTNRGRSIMRGSVTNMRRSMKIVMREMKRMIR